MQAWMSAHEFLFQAILVYSVLAFSVQVSLRAGTFSLAGVGCWAVGGYTLGILHRYGVSPAVAIVVAIALAGVMCFLLALILVRLRGLYLAMATIAFDQMIGIALVNGGSFTGGETGLYGINVGVTTLNLVVVVAMVAALLWALERGALGRAYDVVRDDDELAASLALDSTSMRRFAFVLAGMIGALGGALNAMLLGIATPADAGFPVIVMALTMVIVGGFHSWRGALIGAALIQWLPVGLQSFGIKGMTDSWSLIYGTLIVIIAIFVPRGLLGALQASWGRLALRSGAQSAAAADDLGAGLAEEARSESTQLRSRP